MADDTASIAAEFSLLCACMSWPQDHASRDRVARCASADIDWAHFVALAKRHRVAALCASALRASDIQLSPHSNGSLQKLARTEALKELALAGEAVRLIKIFSERGIEPVLLKGVSIALTGYRRLGLRTNRDIDLLVHLKDVEECDRLLTACGYERVEPAGPLSKKALKEWSDLHKDMVFFNRTNDFIVEVHWRLFDNPHLAPMVQAASATKIAYGGVSASVLPTSHNVIYLCLHGMQHAWSRMKWLADLAAILSRLSCDEVADIRNQARFWGLSAPVDASLSLCARLLNVDVPRTILSSARSSWRSVALERIAMRALTGGGAAELEDQNFGSTWKNVGHYLFRLNLRYLLSEVTYDLLDDSSPAGAGRFSRLALRLPRWIIDQSHRNMAHHRLGR